MKINPNQTPHNVFKLYDLKQHKAEEEKTEGSISHLDKVGINKLSSKEVNLAKISKSDQDVDDAKVERIRNMIAKGEYKVDAFKVAERIISSHLR